MSCEQLLHNLFCGLPLPRCCAYLHGLTPTSCHLSNETFLLFFPPIKLHVEGGGKDLFTSWLSDLLILIVLVLLAPSVPLRIHYQQVEEAEKDKSGREEEQQEGVRGRTQLRDGA